MESRLSELRTGFKSNYHTQHSNNHTRKLEYLGQRRFCLYDFHGHDEL